MPIFGITASSNMSTKLTDFYQIATTTLGSSQSSITFSSIPQDYTHLHLRLFTKTNRSSGAGVDDMTIRLNSDSGANYSIHGLYEFNGVASFGTANNSGLTAQGGSAANTVANVFGITIVDLLDYTNTNKFKTARILTGSDSNYATSGYFGFEALDSGNWRNTAAVTSITLTPASGTAYLQYSSASLYGIKG
jgi:hypothetical protein